MHPSIFDSFLSTPEMLGVFGDESIVQAMLDVEAALAEAQAAEGLISHPAAQAIAEACQAGAFDLPALLADGRRAGSLAIPLVRQLTERVRQRDAEAAHWVHWGSTSQDVIDTAMVLATRQALVLIDRDLSSLIGTLFALADRHGDAPVLARTLMQPASVVSFGFKVCVWLQPLVRAQQRLQAARGRALQLQLGGAVGTLSAMGDRGPAVARRMASALQLPEPHGAWHTQRDDWVALGCEIGVLCGSLGKIAKDWSLMGQAEVGELAEPSGSGRGGSTAMPHKRNPVSSMLALAAAQRAPQRAAALLQAMPQEHERGLGNWQAELAEWAGLFASAHGALQPLCEAAAGLEIDTPRMRRNIDALQGLVCAEAVALRLARLIGKPDAQALLEQLSRRVVAEGRPLRELVDQAIEQHPALRDAVPPAEIDALFDAGQAAQPARERARELLQRLRTPH